MVALDALKQRRRLRSLDSEVMRTNPTAAMMSVLDGIVARPTAALRKRHGKRILLATRPMSSRVSLPLPPPLPHGRLATGAEINIFFV